MNVGVGVCSAMSIGSSYQLAVNILVLPQIELLYVSYSCCTILSSNVEVYICTWVSPPMPLMANGEPSGTEKLRLVNTQGLLLFTSLVYLPIVRPLTASCCCHMTTSVWLMLSKSRTQCAARNDVFAAVYKPLKLLSAHAVRFRVSFPGAWRS